MLHKFAPIVLSGLLILGSIASPVLADTPPKSAVAPGEAAFQKGWKYEQGLGTPISIAEAIRAYREAVAAGHPLAKARLAWIFFIGNGVVKNVPEAERLAKGIGPDILKAAEQNNAPAQVTLASMYWEGLGVARDGAEALKWARKAADQNLPLALLNIGVVYEHGEGVPRDVVEAAKWFRKAADLNNAPAQAFLGDFYLRGQGVPQNDVEAFRLYRLSAAQNFAHGQTNLGYMYDHGCAVPYNPFEAARLYRLAADQNFAVAQHNLGVMYEHGSGVPQDLNEAVKWYTKAAQQGDKDSVEALRCLGYEL